MPGITLSGLKLVADMVLEIIRGYEAGKKEFFSTHVDPLHDRMLTIHKDYIAGFEEAKSYLDSKETPPSQVIEFLEQRRRDYVVERELAEMLAQELANAESRFVRDQAWASLREYCRAIVHYFQAASEVGGTSWYSFFLQNVRARTQAGISDVWDSQAISGDARQDLLRQLSQLLDKGLPAAFRPINTYYAVLRTRLL
jgi:hypothetical protein